MRIQTVSDRLHRVVKLAIDTGEVASLEEAEKLFGSYRLLIEVGPDVAVSPTLQAALLTAVNTARRCFLGGVLVAGTLDVGLRVPWRRHRTLREAVIDLHANVAERPVPDVPRVIIGNAGNTADVSAFAVRATFDGWIGSVVPLDTGRRLGEQQECTLAGVFAGALSVSEAFQYVRGGNVMAGRREIGLSLWRPELQDLWLEGKDRGPLLELLPSRLWLIGLGHLGQAYLWTLGLLPYARPHDVQLVLQDYDVLVPANDSTSLLTTEAGVGQKKTRAMAYWCEERGFRSVIQERRFAPNFRVDDDEPHIALCGVDNSLARSALEDVGFRRVIEAGLGAGTNEYLAFQIHTFPARRTARQHWGGAEDVKSTTQLVERAAYRKLAADGIDECGLTMLAGRTVGAPFVGAVTAALVVAELIRIVLGDHSYEVIDGTLRALQHRQAIINEQVLDLFNPGSTPAGLTSSN